MTLQTPYMRVWPCLGPSSESGSEFTVWAQRSDFGVGGQSLGQGGESGSEVHILGKGSPTRWEGATTMVPHTLGGCGNDVLPHDGRVRKRRSPTRWEGATTKVPYTHGGCDIS